MSAMHPPTPDRLHDLLADQALQGLDADERRELDAMLMEHPELDAEAYDRAAAALGLAFVDIDEPIEAMPALVKRGLEDKAIGWLASSRGLRIEPGPAPRSATEMTTTTTVETTGGRGWLPWLAAAAAIALAALAWWPEPAAPSLADTYAALAAEPSVTKVSWVEPSGSDTITGDVVWDQTRQTGVMRFRGLALNDPQRMQYQLWIFDAKRSAAFNAVDGGVFDVDRASGDVFVEIVPKLEVFEPALFAITTEPPGGVVKHEDGPNSAIILVADPASGKNAADGGSDAG